MFSSLLLPTFYGGYSWLNDVYKVLPPILYAILGVLGAAGGIYAIILGINLAKADSEDKRKQAATRLKNTLFGVATLIVLVVFINVLLPLILEAVLPAPQQ